MVLDRVHAEKPGPGIVAAPAPAENAATPQKRTQPLKVLVVDDEPLIRWSLRRGLTRNGHEVHEATTAVQTLNVLSGEGSFDVVVLDYRLPDRRDLSLLQQVRQASPESVVVMMTAYGEPGMREEARALGALTVIDKPFQVAELIRLIESA
jgi:DNA-binding NtrC family response regulator